MRPSPKVRKLVAQLLTCSLPLAGLLSLTAAAGRASHKHFNASSAKTSAPAAPRAEAVDEATRARVREAYDNLPLSFEENRGQVDAEVRYLSRGLGYALFLTQTEAVLSLQRADAGGRREKGAPRRLRDTRPAARPPQPDVLRMKLKGANPAPAVTAEHKTGAQANYFKGNDPKKWRTNVARFGRVRYAQVYAGVDVVYYGERQQLEYDFEVAPGADTRQITLEFAGVKRMKVERATGDLVLKTAGGEVRQRRPVAYQEVGGARREVESRYVLRAAREVRLEVGEYDRTRPLVIDPVLTYSTFFGSAGFDYAAAIAVDSSGHAYITGNTWWLNLPLKNPYQTRPYEYGPDAFVAKLDTNTPGRASLLYSTYLGGDSYDYGLSIAVDSYGNAYVAGTTESTDFPTLNEYQSYQAYSDAFVVKLDTNLAGAASLRYSTYLGGANNEGASGVAVDAAGNVYAAGTTDSTDFPVRNQYQTDQPSTDAFVTKLNPNLAGAASLLYSTYLGGDSYDYALSIAADSSGIAYVAGETFSYNFPTLNAYQPLFHRDTDAFVTKLDTNVSGPASLLYSTYLGGDNEDQACGIAADAAGNAYVTGTTISADFPTLNAYQPHRASFGNWDAFVVKLDTNVAGAAALRYSTYLGGETFDQAYGIAVDSYGNAYVTGATDSSDFPTVNAYQSQRRGYWDAFVAKLDPNASGAASLLYSTYLGGTGGEVGVGVAADSAGYAYVTGTTNSIDFPRVNAFQARHSQPYDDDPFVTKLADSYRVSGRVTSDGRVGISAVTMTVSGSQNKSVLTNGNGYYSFILLGGGDYTVTPSKGDLIFIPAKRGFVNLQENQTDVNFTTHRATLSGRVTVGTDKGLAGVTMTLTGGTGFATRTVITSPTGTYSFGNLPTPRSYKVTPSKAGYNFDPAQTALLNLTGNQSGVNFVASPKTNTGP
jgi:hypothetical protein